MTLLGRHRPKLADARLPAPTLAQAPAVVSQSQHQAALFALKKDQAIALKTAGEALEKANAEIAKLQSKLDEATKTAGEALEKANAKKPETKPSK